jgi:hypothetical protein
MNFPCCASFFFRENAKSFAFWCIDRKESFYKCTSSEEPTPCRTTQPTRPKPRWGSKHGCRSLPQMPMSEPRHGSCRRDWPRWGLRRQRLPHCEASKSTTPWAWSTTKSPCVKHGG